MKKLLGIFLVILSIFSINIGVLAEVIQEPINTQDIRINRFDRHVTVHIVKNHRSISADNHAFGENEWLDRMFAEGAQSIPYSMLVSEFWDINTFDNISTIPCDIGNHVYMQTTLIGIPVHQFVYSIPGFDNLIMCIEEQLTASHCNLCNTFSTQRRGVSTHVWCGYDWATKQLQNFCNNL
ncbi:MAG: hypothetical protein FWD01_01600 [Defluviitaleaceae bacterium]|nr:hypothetical protein [Defluviitaleaceae bacterium]